VRLVHRSVLNKIKALAGKKSIQLCKVGPIWCTFEGCISSQKVGKLQGLPEHLFLQR
jgi:hypothetical protein